MANEVEIIQAVDTVKTEKFRCIFDALCFWISCSAMTAIYLRLDIRQLTGLNRLASASLVLSQYMLNV